MVREWMKKWRKMKTSRFGTIVGSREVYKEEWNKNEG